MSEINERSAEVDHWTLRQSQGAQADIHLVLHVLRNLTQLLCDR